MSDDLSQLDELIESDVLEALGESLPAVLIDDANGELANIPEELADILDTTQDQDNDINDEEIDIGEIEMLPMAEIESALEEQEEEESASSVNIDTTDLASLLSQLLNNKTIEITIKIKD